MFSENTLIIGKNPTSEHIAIAKAIISNPASMLRIFFALPTTISLLDNLKAMPAVSCLLTDGVDAV